jgi:hypothetical protein
LAQGADPVRRERDVVSTARRPEVVAGTAIPACRGCVYDAAASFDPAKYIAANPDVATAGVDPLVHFCKFGFKEGRLVRPRMK